jgi:hypothetical protein
MVFSAGYRSDVPLASLPVSHRGAEAPPDEEIPHGAEAAHELKDDPRVVQVRHALPNRGLSDSHEQVVEERYVPPRVDPVVLPRRH